MARILNKFDKENDSLTLEAPILILFAQYLGYESKMIEACEAWCDGKIPPIGVQKYVMIEARVIYEQMKKDYERKEILKWFEIYYAIILSIYVDELEEMAKNSLS